MDETQPLLPPSEDVVAAQHELETDPAIVRFDPKGDAENPLDWPVAYKWGIVGLLAFMAFTVTFTCISVVPVASHIVADLSGHPSKSASVLLVTIWELGEAAGPLLIAPLSEVYGRYPVFNAANMLFVVGVALAALSPSTGLLIFARFLTGTAVAGNVLNPAVVGDLFPTESRGSAMSLVMLAPLIGGAVGPAIAGAIAQSTGWRQILWMSMILAVVCEVCFLTLFRETYQIPILRRRAARLREEMQDEALKTAFDTKGKRAESVIWTSIARPARVLHSSFVLQIMSLYGAVIFSFFYIMSTTLPEILQNEYHMPPALIGSSFLTFSIGSIVGIVVCNTAIDRIYTRLQHRPSSDGTPQPENRLPLVIVGAFALPLSVTLYGWSAQAHWPVTILLLSIALMGFSVILAIVPMMAYVVDAFSLYSASALTAVLISRCLMGTFLPLAAAPLNTRLGYGFGFMVLAAICVAVAPIPVVVMRYGRRWRQASEYTRDSEERK
ncbi:hypothetical protein LTR85_004198 [Meristemomyces frigidus]|nr:hypothetical protein LTR85_004198 [Meristemomyces frigidus]